MALKWRHFPCAGKSKYFPFPRSVISVVYLNIIFLIFMIEMNIMCITHFDNNRSRMVFTDELPRGSRVEGSLIRVKASRK